MSKRRVVVTGLRTVCQLEMMLKRCGKTLKTEFVESMKLLILIQRTSKVKLAGEIKNLNMRIILIKKQNV